jgi:cobalamin biosynthesis protein CobD/CbiB
MTHKGNTYKRWVWEWRLHVSKLIDGFFHSKKRLFMCMNGLQSTGGTNVLDTPWLKLFNILLIYYLFLFPQISSHPRVLLVQQMKHINNILVPQVFKVILHVKLYTPMFGVQLTSLGLVVHTIILFLWIIIPNICGFIQCLQNLLFLAFFPQFKMLVEKWFQSINKTLYSDNGGEFQV